MNRDSLRAKIAVIGSGPGGAVTAALLAEAGRDVLILEEGRHLPLESCEPFTVAEMEQKYRNGGLTPAFGQPKIAYVEGRCAGGGSEINSGLYHRVPDDILERWRAEYQLAESSPADLLPFFRENEADLCVQTMPPPCPPASLKLHEGATALGWKSMEVPRWFDYEKAAGASGGTKGTRKSMTRTFIPRALRAGAKLEAGFRVDRLAREGNQWAICCETDAPDGEARDAIIHADVVFVCCGAVQTPALLRRSGITRNVGDQLQMHPTIKATALFRDTVNAPGMGVPVHQVKEFSPRISLGCSISSPAYLALALLDHPDCADMLCRWPQMAIYYAMITPEGRGTVRPLRGFRDPLVRFHLTEGDRRNLSDALDKLARCLFAAGAEVLYPSIAGSSPLRSPADLSLIPKAVPADRTNLMTIHLFSSCPMGEDRARCAANSFGAVHDQPNLYIADGSLLCTAPGVNPQGGIMAFARRNARRFLDSVR